MTVQVAVDTQFMREVNSSTILLQLRDAENMSVSALASAVGLSRQAVSRSLSDLEANGLIEFSEPDRQSSRTGRPPQLVRFRAEAGYVLGIYVNPNEIRIAISDLLGAIIHSGIVELTTEPSDTSAIDVLVKCIETALQSAKLRREDIWFASIGAPGIVDPAAGMIRLIPSMPGLAGDVIVRNLKATLNCPIYLDNDIKLATEGERWREASRADESLVFVHWGERIGAGIVLEGKLLRGASNDAGDIGFLDLLGTSSTMRRDDPNTSNTLRLGPFEEWVGVDALIRLALDAAHAASDEQLAKDLKDTSSNPLDAMINAVLTGNPVGMTVIEEAARRFAMAVAVIRVVLDPELVIIGGPVARCGDVLLEAINSQLSLQPLGQPSLAISSFGDDAVVRGAIRHSLTELERFKFQRERVVIER